MLAAMTGWKTSVFIGVTAALTMLSAARAAQIDCSGLFGRDTSHAALVKAFGADNVVYKKIDGPSKWLTPFGIRIGTPFGEVEKQNGKPFRLNGFGWDLGGSARFDMLHRDKKQ